MEYEQGRLKNLLVRRPPHPWEHVSLGDWNDWRWQLAHRLNTAKELSQIIHLTPEEIEGLSASGHFRVDITPYFASLLDPTTPTVPSVGK